MSERAATPRSLLTRALLALWMPVALVVVVWFATAASTSFYFPPAWKVWDQIVTGFRTGVFWDAMSFSLKNYVLGVLVAALVGVVAGLLLGDNPRLLAGLTPLLNFMRAVPHVAFVPVIILALGIGSAPKVFLIAFACVWPVLLNTIEGVRGLNPAILEAARAYRVPGVLRLRRVTFSGALPQIFAGLRIAVSVGVVMMVVSEMYGSAQGLGYYVFSAGQRFDATGTWAGTIVIGFVGYLINVLFMAGEHYALGWHFRRPRRTRSAHRNRRPSATGKAAVS